MKGRAGLAQQDAAMILPAGAHPVGPSVRRMWRAFPSWPDFRLLVPDTPEALSAARTFGADGPGEAIGLLGFEKGEAGDTFVARALRALASGADIPWMARTEWKDWILLTGERGEGNHAVVVVLNGGLPALAVKIERRFGGGHLERERGLVRLAAGSLGPLGTRVAKVVGGVVCEGHSLLAYRFEPAAAAGRLERVMRLPRLALACARWLARTAVRTRSYSRSAREAARADLRVAAAGGAFPPGFSGRACEALEYFLRVDPPRVLCHGDFGVHNMRIPRDPARFRVLDWAGMDAAGMPFVDALSFAVSAGLKGAAGRWFLRRYARDAGLPVEMASHCWTAHAARWFRRLGPMPGLVALDAAASSLAEGL